MALKRINGITVDGLNRVQKVNELVDEFVDSGGQAIGIRDIWYKIKDYLEAWKPYDAELPENPTEKEVEELAKRERNWEVTVNLNIGERLFERYNAGETDIYTDLDFSGSQLLVDNSSVPIILVSEKKTKVLALAAEELGAGLFLASGQIPSFELAFVIDYFLQTANQLAYVFIITDYDLGGVEIYKSLNTKLLRIANSVMTEVDLQIIHVDYGTHEEIISKYRTYMLKPGAIAKWQAMGRGIRGVQLNVIDDLTDYIDKAILEHVDPAIFEELSLQRAQENRLRRVLTYDEDYQYHKKEARKLYDQHVEEVENEETEFKPLKQWFAPIRDDMVEWMTVFINRYI